MVLDNARDVVADTLGVRADEVTFTSSGTDAVHRGLLGLHAGTRRHRPGLVLGAAEHASVRHAVAWSAAPQAEARVDSDGVLTVDSALEAVARCPEQVGVIAVQAANHEVGTVQPVAEIADATGLPLFVDACASMGRLPLPSGWAVAAGSAHKWGGPAGVGVMVVRKGARWRAALPGDDRADPRSVGFENVPAIFGAAAALQAVWADAADTDRRQRHLTDLLRGRLAQIPDTDVVGHPIQRLPHLVTASFLYVDGEALVVELDRAGFAVASGSACAASTLEPSAVLAAMGALTHGNIRVSLTRDTTEADVIGLADAITDLVPRLRARVGL